MCATHSRAHYPLKRSLRSLRLFCMQCNAMLCIACKIYFTYTVHILFVCVCVFQWYAFFSSSLRRTNAAHRTNAVLPKQSWRNTVVRTLASKCSTIRSNRRTPSRRAITAMCPARTLARQRRFWTGTCRTLAMQKMRA